MGKTITHRPEYDCCIDISTAVLVHYPGSPIARKTGQQRNRCQVYFYSLNGDIIERRYAAYFSKQGTLQALIRLVTSVEGQAPVLSTPLQTDSDLAKYWL